MALKSKERKLLYCHVYATKLDLGDRFFKIIKEKVNNGYLPMQKPLNISPKRSSAENSPVISFSAV